MLRVFRRVADGAWLHDMYGGAALEIPAADHLARVSERHGLDPADLEVIESEDDPRTGELVRADVAAEREPDPQGFMAAARDALGRDAAIDLANAYPAVLIAIREGDYEIARYGIDRMQNDGVIDEDTRQALHALMTEAGIPESIE